MAKSPWERFPQKISGDGVPSTPKAGFGKGTTKKRAKLSPAFCKTGSALAFCARICHFVLQGKSAPYHGTDIEQIG